MTKILKFQRIGVNICDILNLFALKFWGVLMIVKLKSEKKSQIVPILWGINALRVIWEGFIIGQIHTRFIWH